MLDGNAHAVALDTPYIGGAHLAGQEGILGEILEVTAAERVAVQVLTGSQENVGAVFLHLFTHGGGEFLHQVGVEGGSQHGTYRETGAVESLVRTGTGRVDTQTGRAVGQHGVGDTQPIDGAGGTGSGEGTGGHGAPAATYYQRGFLFQGHGLEDIVNVVLVQFGLGHQGSSAQGSNAKHEKFLHKILKIGYSLTTANLHKTSFASKYIVYLIKHLNM